ncbi:putative MFS transporter [Karstenula rhodostoma CBS 690.94]|uniref:MFS transporter n=1 Tax=Karstenula rhodostoma CBS 690.94 TaxID=1392251 RepID=A0A9P4PRY0_9PLEO|nr:putative MFS transporter [Karstenula rhodostoma CBS 690.94]
MEVATQSDADRSIVQKTKASSIDSRPQKNDASTFGLKTILLLTSVFLCVFLVGLDRTIVSTAIPSISNDFNALSDVGWYGSAYTTTNCCFQLVFGKFYAFFPTRVVLIASVFLFEIASSICGAAPNSIAFIVGRAIAGVGAAGIMAGNIMCIVHTVPLAKRPALQGMMSATMGVATVTGPLIGGAFTSHVTWRWCFYINLPVGAISIVAILLFLDLPDNEQTKLPMTQKVAQIDFPGSVFLLPGIVCLLLALQWGGQTYAWSSSRIIVLLVLQGVLLLGFVTVQICLPKTATTPPRLFKYRSLVSGLWAAMCIGASQYIFIYYLPLWFQSIKHVSAVSSGIRLLPLMLSTILGGISGGIINQKIGYFTPLAILGACMMSIGAGLLTTLQVDSGAGKWIGYQVLYGLGTGYCFQSPMLAVQTVIPKKDVPMGLALILFGQLLGASVFVSVGENVLANQLLKRLNGIPGFDRSLVTSGGATTFLDALPADYQARALSGYNEALRKVFQIGLILACFVVLGVASLEWKSVKKAQPDAQKGQEQEPKGGDRVNETSV